SGCAGARRPGTRWSHSAPGTGRALASGPRRAPDRTGRTATRRASFRVRSSSPPGLSGERPCNSDALQVRRRGAACSERIVRQELPYRLAAARVLAGGQPRTDPALVDPDGSVLGGDEEFDEGHAFGARGRVVAFAAGVVDEIARNVFVRDLVRVAGGTSLDHVHEVLGPLVMVVRARGIRRIDDDLRLERVGPGELGRRDIDPLARVVLGIE